MADFYEFSTGVCVLVIIDSHEAEINALKGSAKVVTQERFLKFVKKDLFHVLGRFENSKN